MINGYRYICAVIGAYSLFFAQGHLIGGIAYTGLKG